MVKTIPYDPAVIEEFAGRLYARARSLVILYGILGFIVGAVLAGAASNANLNGMLSMGAFVVATLIGVSIGMEKGFNLRLQAQTLLCQAQIERNTRKT